MLIGKSFNSKGFINKIPANNVDRDKKIRNIEKAIKLIIVSLIVTVMIGAYIMGFNLINVTFLNTLINEQTSTPIDNTFANNACSTNDFMKLYSEAMKLETGNYLGKIIFYSMSNGTKPPNSKIGFYLRGFSDENQYDEIIKGIKMEIFFHDPKKNVCKKVYEDIVVRWSKMEYTIDDQVDVYYLVVVKVIDKKERIVDAKASLIYVSFLQEVNAKLVSDKKVYGRWEVMKFCLVNEGPTRIEFGLDYYVYYYNGTEWTRAEWLEPGIIPLILIVLEPGQAECFELNLNGTKPGKYMLVKEIYAQGVKDGKRKLTLEFEVVENLDLVKIASLSIQVLFIIKTFKVFSKTGYFKIVNYY